MRRFFIKRDNIFQSTIIVSGNDANHIKNVLRLCIGDNITLIDGTNTEYNAKITHFTSKTVHTIIIETKLSSSESPIQITIAQAFLKNKKMDLLIKTLTELGVTNWIPFVADRSISILDNKRLKNRLERWQKISKEATKQCKRGKPPVIQINIPNKNETFNEINKQTHIKPLSFKDIINNLTSFDIKIIFWENESTNTVSNTLSLLSKFDTPQKNILLILGPEGGFTIKEIQLARLNNFQTLSLGPRILRSETATIAAATLIQYFFGDMGEIRNFHKI